MLLAAAPIVYLFKACGAKLGWAWGIGSFICSILTFWPIQTDTDPKYRMEPSLTGTATAYQYNWQYHNITSCIIHGSRWPGGQGSRLVSARSQVQFYQPPGVTEVLWAWQCAHSDHIRAEQWSYFKPGVQGTVSLLNSPYSLPRWDSNLGLLITSSILLPLSHGLLLTVVLQID